MKLTQFIGWMLLLCMIFTAYGLFGADTVESSPVKSTKHANVSDTPEISGYVSYTVEEQVTVNVGGLVIIGILIMITSIGSVPRMKIHPEKGSKDEIEGDDDNDKE